MSLETLDEKILKEFVDTVIDQIKLENKTHVNYTFITLKVMEFVEQHKKEDKKDTAIALVNHILIKLGEEGIGGITPATDEELLGDSIELFLDAIKGKFDIHRITKAGLDCFPRCLKRSSK